MSRVLLIQPTLRPPGGDRMVANWMIEALKRDHQLTVVTMERPDLDGINRFYGTSLEESDFELVCTPSWPFRLLEIVPLPLVRLRNGLFDRLCRPLVGEHDVVLTANNERDFGCRVIQYVHFPWRFHPRPVADLRWYHGSARLLAAYHRVADALADFSEERARHNLTLVNSEWAGRKFAELYGRQSTTLYPPVSIARNDTPCRERSNGFVCVGRLAREKELERVITVLEAVRERGHDVHLHAVGSADDRAYSRKISREIVRRSAWISFDENLPRAQLEKLLGEHRYGIHGMREEHFGIAVAEMARAGCIVFVPNGGGQLEIVQGLDPLTYDDEDEAVEKISRVLDDSALQDRLQRDLLAGSERFSTESFALRLREIVRGFIDEGRLRSSPPPDLEPERPQEGA